MKKLIVLIPQGMPNGGHREVTVEEDIKTEFERIIREGYGGIPAVFIAEKKGGILEKGEGSDAMRFLDDMEIEEVTVITPMAGG